MSKKIGSQPLSPNQTKKMPAEAVTKAGVKTLSKRKMQNTTLAESPQAENELVPASEAVNLELMERADAPAIWSGYRADVEKLKASIDAVLASDPSLPANAKLARVTRLGLRTIRIGVEKKRVELKEGYLQKSREIDSAATALKALIEPYEEKLLAIEDHAANVEAERIRKLTADRIEAISKFATVSAAVDYGALSDEEFTAMLSDAEMLHKAKAAEAARVEAERIAKEKADAAERERVRLENEQLRKEAAEKEAALEAERKERAAEAARVADEARKEREKIESAAKVEREKLEAKAAAERKEAEAKAKADREAREKAEAEAAAIRTKEAKRVAEEKAKREAEEKAAKKAAAAPDKKKLEAFAEWIRSQPVPDLTTDAGKNLLPVILAKVDQLANFIETKATELA